MLYYLVRSIARIAIWIFFRKIYFSQVERVPKGKPVLLAVNHPTGFVEPCVLAVLMRQPLFFLVASIYFPGGLLTKAMYSLNMLPVYRFRDTGAEGAKNNVKTFQACHQALQENKTMAIFVEGRTKHEKRLRPVQSGLARIAMGALEARPELEDVFVVPVGVNYTYADQFRQEIMVDFGEPMSSRSFFERYEGNNRKAVAALTAKIEQEMADHIVIINRPEDEQLTENLLIMDRSERKEFPLPIFSRSPDPLYREKQIADWVNEADQQALDELSSSTNTYFEAIKKHRLSDWAIHSKNQKRRWRRPLIWIGAPLALLGYLFTFPPARVLQYLKETKVKRVEFHAPILLAGGLGLYLLYFLLWALIALILQSWIVLVGVLVLGLLGVFFLFWREEYREQVQLRRWRNLPVADQDHLKNLRQAVEF